MPAGSTGCPASPVHGSYLTDLLPGLAAALINTSSTVGAALGLAILTAIATSRTSHLIAGHADTAHALTGGFQAALLACSTFLVGAALIASRATNTRAARPAADETAEPNLAIPQAGLHRIFPGTQGPEVTENVSTWQAPAL